MSYLDDIRAIASELTDGSPRTQLEIVKKCRNICVEVANAIEEEVTTQASEITTTLVNEALDEVITRLTALETLTATHTSSISSLQNALSSLQTSLTTLQGQVDTLDADVSLLQTEMADAQEDIESLLSRVTVLETSISMSKIVDADGNARFVDIDPVMNDIEGVEWLYTKCSLSGTILTIVIAGTIANETTISSSTDLGYFHLPTYILNKIVNIYSSNSYVDYDTFKVFNASTFTNPQEIGIALRNAYNNIYIRTIGSFTATADGVFRIQFNLLIDSE